MALSDCVKDTGSRLFDSFWIVVLDAYRPKEVTHSYGDRKNALKAFNEYPLLHTEDHVKELSQRLINEVEDYKAKQRDGALHYLQHVGTWIRAEKWAEDEERYIPVVKKLPTDRPMPEPIMPRQDKQHTPEERAKMQAEFKQKIKGVRKHGG